jgi:hypothetical protein
MAGLRIEDKASGVGSFTDTGLHIRARAGGLSVLPGNNNVIDSYWYQMASCRVGVSIPNFLARSAGNQL